MRHGFTGILSFISAGLLICMMLGYWDCAEAAGQIYVNNGQNILSGDIGSAYVVGGSGTVSVAGGAYAITGNGVQNIGQPTTTPPTTTKPIPDGGEDGTTVSVNTTKARIGLYYYYSDTRDTALSYANLENEVGSGYQFGYYDSSRVFHQLGSTGITTITMVPDLNTAVPVGTVGCYHIRLPKIYADFASAQADASKYSGGFPAYINGAYYAMVGNYQSASGASSAQTTLGITGTVFTGSCNCVAVTKTDTTKILFEFDCGTASSLAVHPVADTKAKTWFKQNVYYGDFEYYRYVNDELTVINVVNVEDYIKGVILAEMSNSWPIEALKAQALCARSYYATNAGTYLPYGFDVTADTYSQAYKGISLATENSNTAVDETAGEYITYNGKICSTLYFSSDGGGTEDSENIFTNALPYCRGVIDPFEDAVPASMNSRKSWSVQISASDIATKLNNKGYSIGSITSVTAGYSDTNNVISLTFTDSSGKCVNVSKGTCFSICCGTLGLNSVHFTITKNNDTYVFNGGGWGHNVGMSQFGAYSMAKFSGLNYRQIIRFYFTGVNISKGIVA